MDNENVLTTPATDNTAPSVEEQDTALLNSEETGEEKPQTEATPPAENKDAPDGDDGALLTADDEDGGGKEDEAKEPTGAPETYQEFTLPEGFTLDGEMLEQATTLFRELDLTQDKAQKLVDYYTKRAIDDKSNMLSELAERRKTWRAEVRNRPDFQKEKALAKLGMREVVTDPDEKELFSDSWMSDHPALWKIFVKIGRMVSEDRMPTGGGDTAPRTSVNMMRFPQK